SRLAGTLGISPISTTGINTSTTGISTISTSSTISTISTSSTITTSTTSSLCPRSLVRRINGLNNRQTSDVIYPGKQIDGLELREARRLLLRRLLLRRLDGATGQRPEVRREGGIVLDHPGPLPDERFVRDPVQGLAALELVAVDRARGFALGEGGILDGRAQRGHLPDPLAVQLHLGPRADDAVRGLLRLEGPVHRRQPEPDQHPQALRLPALAGQLQDLRDQVLDRRAHGPRLVGGAHEGPRGVRELFVLPVGRVWGIRAHRDGRECPSVGEGRGLGWGGHCHCVGGGCTLYGECSG
ncbi:hypothetical protein BP00DRAFT_464918, partial [Aspergillus indologenus CBS 114.80]